MPMFTPAAAPLPSLARAIVTLLRAVKERVCRTARALRHRREAAILVELDDRMLRDIGLNRSDLRDAISEPMWRDPTAILASRAAERRTHRRSNSPPLAPDLNDAAEPTVRSFARYY